VYHWLMASIRHIHRYITDRSRVLLNDGRTGKIVRVDTIFPQGTTTVSVWTDTPSGPGVAKVKLDAVVGPAPKKVPA
jgi:hypothetical protein